MDTCGNMLRNASDIRAQCINSPVTDILILVSFYPASEGANGKIQLEGYSTVNVQLCLNCPVINTPNFLSIAYY